jgi:hypothetical protein
MSSLHETQIGKTQKIAGYVISILASLMILMAGMQKVMGSVEMINNMSGILNFADKLFFIGVLELVLLLLYWIPKTSNLGFFLLCSFCGGAIVTEMVLGEAPMGGITVTVFFYLGTVLRKPSLLGMGK